STILAGPAGALGFTGELAADLFAPLNAYTVRGGMASWLRRRGGSSSRIAEVQSSPYPRARPILWANRPPCFGGRERLRFALNWRLDFSNPCYNGSVLPLRRAVFILVVLLAPAQPVRAEFPLELNGKHIVQVELVGETATMISYQQVGIPIGAPLTRTLLRKAILRLARSGRWADIQIDAVATKRGVKLKVYLTAYFIIRRIELMGNQELDEQQLSSALGVTTGSRLSRQDLEEVKKRIRKSYASQGYLKAKVYVALRNTEDLLRKDLIVHIEEGPATRIAEVIFRGDQPINADRVLGEMSLGIGDVLNRRSATEGVRRAERYLREKGFLETDFGEPLISVEQNRAVLTIPSKIGPHYKILIRGAEPLKQSAVFEALELTKQHLLDPMAVKGISERVKDLYQRYGFYDVKMSVTREADRKPGRATLLVRIEPGKQLRVVSLSFAGARYFEESFLRDQLVSYLEEDLPGSNVVEPVDSKVADEIVGGSSHKRGRDIPPPPFEEPKSVYYPPTYREAVQHIVELYQAEGFLSAKVGPAEMHRFSRNRAAVSIPVVEGSRTLLYRVNLTGNEALGSRELIVEGGFNQDMPFSYLFLEEARLRMLKLYQERGYMYAKIEPMVRFSPDNTRAEVTIRIIERYPVLIDKIAIRGAKRTDRDLIRDLLLFEPGDLYRPSLARESEERLIALGVFSGVKVAPQDPELPERIKTLEVVVSERPIQQLNFFAGVSTGQGLRGGFEYGYRNLFGEAIGTSLRVQLAYQLFILADRDLMQLYKKVLDSFEKKIERRITLGTTIPHIRGLPGLHTSVDLVHLRNNERGFGLVENALALTFRYPLSKRLVLSVGSDLELNTLELFIDRIDLNQSLANNPDGPRLRQLLLIPPGASTLVAGHTTLGYDQRDNPFVPTRGFYTSVRAEVAGTLGEQKIDYSDVATELEEKTNFFDVNTEPDTYVSRFLKMTWGISGYVPIGSRVVLASQLRLGWILHLFPPPGETKPYTYPNRAFFMGGVDTIRGYFQDAMMPQDTADDIIRYNRSVTPDERIKLENVMRDGDAFILFRNEVRFPIVGLLNGGFFTDLGNLWSDTSRIDPAKLLRPSIGAGIRFATPVGPLALDYGILLLRRKAWLNEPFGTLHFSIGLF
ncbi:MAG: BamA/TamA family outer membrane protein, partial [Deltaproteobacteria bacterium]|nr:BamA/TamA family outer membrane protein [Deltaproteobacteria bacterium]